MWLWVSAPFLWGTLSPQAPSALWETPALSSATAGESFLKLWCLSLAAEIPGQGCWRGGPPHAGHLCHRGAKGPRAGGDRRLSKIQLHVRSQRDLRYEKALSGATFAAKPFPPPFLWEELLCLPSMHLSKVPSGFVFPGMWRWEWKWVQVNSPLVTNGAEKEKGKTVPGLPYYSDLLLT